jgi:hypothetical protein
MGEKSFYASGCGVFVEGEQGDAASLLEVEIEVSGGISLDEDIADERARGVVIFELAEMRFPGGIGGGKRVRGGARDE